MSALAVPFAEHDLGRPDVLRVVELACRAPSVHNTQPWRWEVDGTTLRLRTDRSRQLGVADPAGRGLLLGCGAALHHAVVAAAGLGWTAGVTRHPDPRDPDLLARVDLEQGPVTGAALGDLRALEQRRTDRRRFTTWPVPDERLVELGRAGRHPDVHVLPVTGAERLRVDLLITRALLAQDVEPAYASEQRRWVDHGSTDGVPSRVVPHDGLEPLSRRSRFSHLPADHGPGELVESSDGLLVLATETDDEAAWLRAGETLSALWLQATHDGLSVVPLSQVVEMDDTRNALHHHVLGARLHPQLLVRIGWQEIGRSSLPPTPRRPLDDVVTHRVAR